MERARAGDREAFSRLYDRYLNTVFRYIRFRVNSRTVAEDLTQETFLRALRGVRGFTWQDRDPGAWLLAIARNLIVDHYRSLPLRRELVTWDLYDTDLVDPQPDPEATVVDRLTSQTLREAIGRLRTEQRQCLILRFLRGLTVAETAALMARNEGAVRALQHRAVRRLASLLPDGFLR